MSEQKAGKHDQKVDVMRLLHFNIGTSMVASSRLTSSVQADTSTTPSSGTAWRPREREEASFLMTVREKEKKTGLMSHLCVRVFLCSRGFEEGH